MSQLDSDRLLEHNTHDAAMWLGKKDDLADGLVFDLGQVAEIETVEIWNYNKPGYTSRGTAKADIEVLAEDGTWKTVLKDASIQEAEGSADYDDPTILTFGPVKTQKIRLTNLVAFKDEGFTGLSEVRFHKPLGFDACNPQPQPGAKINPSGQIHLAWTPGKDAVVYDIYTGSTPESLTLLGRTTQIEANLSGLMNGQAYYWRIDAVRVDGQAAKGQVWDFALEKGQIRRDWNLDLIADGKSLDAAANQSVELINKAKWLENDGPRKGVIALDGIESYLKADALNLKSSAMTACAWIYADGIQNPFTALLFCRGGNTVAGLNLTNDNELGYHWNNDSNTWGYRSGLFLGQGKWVFVALAVEPTKATLFLYEDGQLKSASNTISHTEEEFDAPLIMGCDPENNVQRFFKGKMDDIKIYNYSLTAQQIQAVAENKAVELLQAESALSLVDTKLIDPQADLKTIAEEVQAAQQDEEPAGKRPLWPIAAIIGIILAIVIFTQIGKKQ